MERNLIRCIERNLKINIHLYIIISGHCSLYIIIKIFEMTVILLQHLLSYPILNKRIYRCFL